MSVIYKGQVIDTNLSRSAMGGTEQMRARLLSNVDSNLLQNVAIHFSRVRDIYGDVQNIFYGHDLPEDPEAQILAKDGWKKFSLLVFVTCWQRDLYIERFGIPYSMCRVIENAIEPAEKIEKPNDKIRLIYHTTPHRGLNILASVFDELTKNEYLRDKLHLDVFSSFAVYGWQERDRGYQKVFDQLKRNPNVTYHGAQPNSVVREYLTKAHYFPYPSTWKETSCIALIEAIEHGVLAIHPNLAALPETAGQNTLMYDYTEKVNEHAATFYSVLVAALTNDLTSHKIINSSPKHNINMFTARWNNLLKELQ
jgi:UDP-glucose:(glucosyl)LPS alpha-1,2-glucosyltransferase